MSDGKTHYNWWAKLLPVSAVLSVAFMLISVWFGISVFIGYLLGAAIEPDLDQISITLSEGKVMRKFGIFGVLWVAYWLPYAFVMPHRSIFSHFPGLSTIIRLLYLSAPIVALSYALGYFNRTNIIYVFPILCGIVIGLSMADAIHFVLDTKLYKFVGRMLKWI